ncbi:FAD-dependent oxidoreductase, partial [archaeon]
MQFDAIIVGGGIGGLATALSLQQAGFRVVILERDENFDVRKQGYGLTLTNSLNGPLAKLGLLEECIQKNTPSKCHFIFDTHGNILGYYGRAIKELNAPLVSRDNKVKHRGSVGNLRIPRQELRRMIIERLSEGTIQWASRFISYEEKGTHVEVTYAIYPTQDNLTPPTPTLATISSTILVGADGIRSRVRSYKNKQDR